MHDWWLGSNGRIVTMAVPSDGSYGVPEGLVCGFPVICTGNGEYEIVKGIELSKEGKERLEKSVKQLEEEAEHVKALI